MNRVLTLAGVGTAALVVWAAMTAAKRAGAGAHQRPRPSFVPFIGMPTTVDGWVRL